MACLTTPFPRPIAFSDLFQTWYLSILEKIDHVIMGWQPNMLGCHPIITWSIFSKILRCLHAEDYFCHNFCYHVAVMRQLIRLSGLHNQSYQQNYVTWLHIGHVNIWYDVLTAGHRYPQCWLLMVTLTSLVKYGVFWNEHMIWHSQWKKCHGHLIA